MADLNSIKFQLARFFENKYVRYCAMGLVALVIMVGLFGKSMLEPAACNPMARDGDPDACPKHERSQSTSSINNAKGKPLSLFASHEELAKLDGEQVEAVLAVGAKDLQAREIQMAKREQEIQAQLDAQQQKMDELLLKIGEQDRRFEMLASSQQQGSAVVTRQSSRNTRNQRPRSETQQRTAPQQQPVSPSYTQANAQPTFSSGDMIRTITQRSVRQVTNEGESEQEYSVSQVSDGQSEALEQKRKEVAAKRKAEEKRKEEEQSVYIPAGSFFQTVSLTGVDAPTQLAAKASPRPVILRVKKEAILPNHFQVDIRECHLVAEATGDLSSERAFMRSNVLSCVRSDGRAVEAALHAQAVSEFDGRLGIAGRLVSKNGSALAGAMAAGFMSGLSEAVAPQRVGSINTSPNDQAVYETINMGDIGASASLKGASSALDKLAEYYIALADQIHPVVEINPGRKISFVTLQGINLKLR